MTRYAKITLGLAECLKIVYYIYDVQYIHHKDIHENNTNYTLKQSIASPSSSSVNSSIVFSSLRYLLKSMHRSLILFFTSFISACTSVDR